MRTAGIIGAGQLGRMLALAAKPLDVECIFLDPAPNPPAVGTGRVLTQDFNSEDALSVLAGCDVVTFEFENVPVSGLEALSRKVPVYPPLRALELTQDRLSEKKLFASLDIPVPAWHEVSSERDLATAIEVLGLPLVLKTRRFGYDGKGQFLIRRRQDASLAWSEARGKALIAEQWIDFDREVSVIGVRSREGGIAHYPMTENVHRNGILQTSRAPAEGEEIARPALDYLDRLLAHLDYVGVLALELFVTGKRVLANEYAPRVHNSGHWTIEGARTSQFENHLRAILGLPLGGTEALGHAGMINLIGVLPDQPQLLEAEGFHMHDYHKAPRPGRKLGHLTVVAPDAAIRDDKLSKGLRLLDIS